jgi:phosphate transport system protein
MASTLYSELNDLKMNLLHIATLAEEAVKKAVNALVQRKDDLAMGVIDGDEQINNLEIEIDEQCLRLLALKQPLAQDLRLITSVLRLTPELERIGDLAVNIAERAIELNERPPLPFEVGIQPLADVAISMLRDSITSFVERDVHLAREVCERDDQADALAAEIVRGLLDRMIKDSPAVRRAVSHIIIVRALERIGDLATNVSEAAILYAVGKSIKHHRDL